MCNTLGSIPSNTHRQHNTYSLKIYSHLQPSSTPMSRASKNFSQELWHWHWKALKNSISEKNISLLHGRSNPAQWKLFHESYHLKEKNKWQRLAGASNKWESKPSLSQRSWDNGCLGASQGRSISQWGSSSQPLPPLTKCGALDKEESSRAHCVWSFP